MVKLANTETAAQKKATRAAYGATLAELAAEGVPVVAVDAAYGFSHGVGEGLASVTLGKFSASLGASDGVSQWRTDAVAAARRELAWTGLLYTGVPA